MINEKIKKEVQELLELKNSMIDPCVVLSVPLALNDDEWIKVLYCLIDLCNTIGEKLDSPIEVELIDKDEICLMDNDETDDDQNAESENIKSDDDNDNNNFCP